MSKRNIEAVYPLSPMQQGMLFHTLYEQESGVFFEQTVCTFSGGLNTRAFYQVWNEVVARHSALRTAFTWKKLKKMLQVVSREVQVPFTELDWREFSPEEQAAKLTAFQQADRKQGFDLAKAPLMRLALIRIADERYDFIWSHHHLLLDGWSNAALLKEVFSLYEAISNGQRLALPPARPYRDYIAWLQQQDAAQAEHFWREYLGGFSTPTSLVVDRKTGKSGFEEQEIFLSKEMTQQVTELARRYQITLGTLLQAAWGLLLSRYSGETDVVFGATVSGRPADLPDVENIVGLFINTLPVRIRIQPDQPLSAWLRDLHAMQASLHQFEYSPLVDIQGWSQVPRSQPLFESLLVFENFPVDAALNAAAGKLQIQNLQSFEQTNYPLNIISGPGERLLLKASYDRARFTASAIDRLLNHLKVILESMVKDEDQLIDNLPILTDAEREQLLVTWNQTDAPFPADRNVHSLFEDQADLRPGSQALIFNDESLSYAELDRRANQLAHHLLANGIFSEMTAAICLDRSFEMIIAILSVLKAGGAFVPLDPTFPDERLNFILSDANAPVLLTSSAIASRFSNFSGKIIDLDRDSAEIALQPDTRPRSEVFSNHLAYIIYTSGSTGTPKGTLLEHQGLVNFTTAFCRDLRVSPESRVLQFSSSSFDASVGEIFAALASGAALCLIPHGTMSDIDELLRVLRQSRVSVVTLPPSLLQLLPADDLPDLKTVASVGEACPPEVCLKWSAGRQFVNGYGPTEATIAATWEIIDNLSPEASFVPIGKPILNKKVFIVDTKMRLVPIGVPGELHIGGIGLARGYLNRPELTSEKFIPNPFRSKTDEKLYKSGDLARFHENGSLEFMGRIDHQAKIRGYRVELGEIEAMLNRYPGIKQSVVTTWEPRPGDKRLAAYLVCTPGAECVPSEIREYLRQRLPDYMVPAVFTTLEAFPLTASGKVDRKALPQPDSDSALFDSGYTAPQSPIQQGLAEMWSEILGVSRVGVHDNFFDLGGHSLLATQLNSRICETFQVDIPLRALFEAPTIAAQAERVERALQQGSGLSLPPILPVPADQPLPLSFSQQRLWFLDQLAPGNLFYNMPLAVRLSGDLDLPVLELALQSILERHAVLRTTFQQRSGAPVQVVAPSAAFSLPVVDLASTPSEQREEQAFALAAAEFQLPFDLANGPLFRAKVLSLSSSDHILILTMHHIVADEWSITVLVRELAALYQAFHQHQPSSLPDLPVQYADFAAWQLSVLQPGPFRDALVSFWKSALANRPLLLDLPADHPRPAVQSWNGATLPFDIPDALAARLRQISRESDATLFMTMLSAYFTLLFRYSNQPQINVGTAIANRSRAETQSLIGFFVNMLVIPADLSALPSFRDLLRQVRESSLSAYAHQDLPFEMLVEALQPQRDLSHSPIFQVAFSFQNRPQPIDLPDVQIDFVDLPSSTAKYDLTLYISETGSGLAASFEFNSDLFELPTIQRMSQHFVSLLEGIARDPELSVASLPMLTPAEQQRMLVDWNTTSSPLPSPACTHVLFERQVSLQPQAEALRFNGQSLSYAELDRRANQLARFLQARGVRSEVIVGLSVPRSFEMVTAFLGVLKAGGAVLPLDPAYPTDRLDFMISDAAVPILLTTQAFADRFPNFSGEVVLLDADWPSIAALSSAPLDLDVSPDALAYLIYTSGSTGRPKGVMVQHSGFANLTSFQRVQFEVSSASRILQFSPISFDASVWEMFMALANGACLVLAQQELLASPPDLVHFLRQERVSIMTVPPSLLLLIPPEALPDLRVVVAAGEACPLELVQRWSPGRAFFNAYGPTESTVCASMFRCNPSDPLPPPIGKPVDHFQLYILDTALQPVPIGVPGELHIGGVGLARGYLNRPELTAERFIPSPFIPGQRLYKSGDLAAFRPDGNIEFLGRIDHQVKVRGFRIELGEIEAALSAHPAVEEAVVMAFESAPGDKRLAAYLLSHAEPLPSPADLRAFLRLHLPEYMLPASFIFLDAFPLSPAGKVDRKALPAPDGARPALAQEYLAPRTDTERSLTTICAGLLGLEQVGVLDNFFDLGGHSLLAAQFVSRVRDAFQVDLPLRALFEFPSIADLALEIDKRAATTDHSLDEKIAEKLAHIQDLSDDEVKALLEQMNG